MNEQTKKETQVTIEAILVLQCGLSLDQLSKVGPFNNAKDLWDKLFELHEGTSNAHIAKRDLPKDNCTTFMKNREMVNQIHG